MHRFLLCVALSLLGLTGCKSKPKDPMSLCQAHDLTACASLCDSQPNPMCHVAAQSDAENAVKYLTKGCDAKDAQACQMLVVRYSSSPTADAAKAKDFADKTCAIPGETVFCSQAKKLLGSAKAQ